MGAETTQAVREIIATRRKLVVRLPDVAFV